MIKKKYIPLIAAFCCGILFSGFHSTQTFAGEWKKDQNGWWYDYGNGSWPASEWVWLDEDGDGICNCYYFDENGYCFMNRNTTDGYVLDKNGQWVMNGVIQTRSASEIAEENSQKEAERVAAANDPSGVYYSIYSISDDGIKRSRKNEWRFEVSRLDSGEIRIQEYYQNKDGVWKATGKYNCTFVSTGKYYHVLMGTPLTYEFSENELKVIDVQGLDMVYRK